MPLLYLFCLIIFQYSFNIIDVSASLTDDLILMPHYSHTERNPPTTKEEVQTRQNYINTIEGKSCAIVGSSSNLIGSNYGSFIDQHDVVFRMNKAPVNKQYTQDIGQKTTVRLLNIKEINPENTELNINPKAQDQFIITGGRARYQPEFKGYQNVLITEWRYNIEPHLKNSGIKNVSCGLKAIYHAITICGEISVLGFGLDNKGNNRGYYYNPRKLLWGPHKPDKQELLIKRFAKEGLINLFMGNAETDPAKKNPSVKLSK